MPFMFAPVALDAKFSLCSHRLRFLTFGDFSGVVSLKLGQFSQKLCSFVAAVQVRSLYPLLI